MFVQNSVSHVTRLGVGHQPVIPLVQILFVALWFTETLLTRLSACLLGNIEEMEAHKEGVLGDYLLKIGCVRAKLDEGEHPWKKAQETPYSAEAISSYAPSSS